MAFVVTLKRKISQRTNSETVDGYLAGIIERALRSYSSKGWKARYSEPTCVTVSDGYEYSSIVTFTRKTERKVSNSEKHFDDIVQRLAIAGESAKFNKYPWLVIREGEAVSKVNSQNVVIEHVVSAKPNQSKDYFKKLNLEKGDLFNDLYGVDDQIEVLHSALNEFKNSKYENRYNVVMYGPPGCGKSQIIRTTAKMLGDENEAYTHLDATSTTAAGISKILLDADFTPPVLFVEEIEKAAENDLKWLLSVTDIRGEIRRTNYRIGNQSRSIKMLCVATVNDMELFSKIAAGALRSRFPLDIYCPRPNRVIMGKILAREIRRNDGRMDWIEPTLNYADKEGLTDPRKIIPIMLCGKDRLMDGSYQEMLGRIKMPGIKGKS